MVVIWYTACRVLVVVVIEMCLFYHHDIIAIHDKITISLLLHGIIQND